MNIFETLNATAEAWEHRYTDKFLVDLVGRMNELADASKLTRREIAERAGWKEAYLSRVLSGQQNLTLRSLAKFEAAVGGDVLLVAGTATPSADKARLSSKASPLERFAAKPKSYERVTAAFNDHSYFFWSDTE